MNLRKQMFTSFLLVAIVPLLIASIYLGQSSIRLAFDLYAQDLYNATEIQADVVEDNLNRLMVRAGQFASDRVVRQAMERVGVQHILADPDMSEEVEKFTDETMDKILFFALVDSSGAIQYSSGSNSDIMHLSGLLRGVLQPEGQDVREMKLDGGLGSLAVFTPIVHEGEPLGMLVVMCRNDYFLKTISSHKQVESSNAFIYCTADRFVVESKLDMNGSLNEFAAQVAGKIQGELLCDVDGARSVGYFRTIARTPWLLVNTIPARQVYAQVLPYGLLSLVALGLCICIIIVLSNRLSRRTLQPINQLLEGVERFFLSGTAAFPQLPLDSKTEIGYLAQQFSGMATQMTAAQEKLKESNYLYKALLRATYELRVVIDYEENTVTSSSAQITAWLEAHAALSIRDRALRFFEETKTVHSEPDFAAVREMLAGNNAVPSETEVCCNLGPGRSECWYRIIAVPVSSADGQVRKTVFHFEDVSARKLEELRLLHSSQRDGLTGLLNKSVFIELTEKLSHPNACNTTFFIDLDHFKQVNDTLGHAAGDAVLEATAKVLLSQFRTTDLVARYGGDEFVVFAPNMPRVNAERKARELVERLSFWPGGHETGGMQVTGSVGVFVASTIQLPDDMMREADAAMYRAKQSGGARYQLVEK